MGRHFRKYNYLERYKLVLACNKPDWIPPYKPPKDHQLMHTYFYIAHLFHYKPLSSVPSLGVYNTFVL